MNILIAAAAYVFTPVVIPGAASVGTWGINDFGRVIVQTDTTSGVWFHGKFTELPPGPPGFGVTAFGINDAGVIVGSAFDTGGVEHGFVLSGGVYRIFSRS